MTEFKQPIDYVPKRIRLFFFFSVMAWVSLFKLQEGQKMIDLVQDGGDYRRNKMIKDIFQTNDPRSKLWL